MSKAGAILLSVLVATSTLAAEDLPSIFGVQREKLEIEPSLRAGGSLKPLRAASPEEMSSGKSPRKAFLFSAILPGAGELYMGAKKRAAVFFGLEALTVGLYMSWKGKGDDIEKEFRQTADEQWDVLSYLAWRGSTISRNSSITHALPCSTYIVNEGSLDNCGGSEKQQYYELMGKYDQFVAGWSDLQDATGNTVQPTQIDSVENYLSENRLVYEDRRDDSNKFLKRASNIAGLILVNHAISAIDAARTARVRRGGERARLERRTRFLFTMYEGLRGQVPMLMAYKPFY